MRRWIQWVVIVCLVAAIVVAVIHSTRPTAEAAVGKLAPDFRLSTFDGQEISLQDLRGKPVFVNFWASWCENCKDESPDLVRVYNSFKGKVQFIGIDLAAGDQESQAKQFIQTYHIPYTILADRNGDVGDIYQVNELPTSYFIDKQGKIEHISVGTLTADSVTNILNGLLNK